MTVGNPATNLIRFSTPLLIGNLAQQLYSTVDSIVVGNYVGDSALAAIGASGPIINLLLVLFMGVSVGASIMASQYFGAKDKKRLSHSVGTAITATFVVSIFIMVVGPLITHPIMSALQTPQDIYTMSCDYLIIILLGILGSAYYNIISGILRGLGDSVMPLIFLLVACGMNIGLDIWFVAGFKMGVAGAAWATIISQAVSGILCLVRLLLMRDVLHITWRTLWPTKALLFQLIRLGLPSGLTQAVFSLAMLVVQSLTNSFGTTIIAVSTVVMRVDGFAMMPNFTFGTATTTFTGQNIGAGRLDRVEKGTKDGLKLGLSVSVVLVALILFFGRYLMEMFTSTPEVIDTGMHMMRILAIGYIAMGRHADPFRRYARRGRYDDPNVDLPHHDRRHPCADRIRPRSTDALCRCAVHLPAHKLGHGCRAYLHRVPHGPLEEEVHHQRRCARTGRYAGLSPISYRKTGQLLRVQTRFFFDRT